MRIKLLDSYRGIAILMVIFFHFFSRWVKVYPYGSDYNFFEFGKLGVQFFFMISGFVILNSLEKTTSILFFLKKRMIRLLPSMLIASILTYIFLINFDDKNLFPSGHYIKNLLISLTFIEPDLISSLIGRRINFDYLSSVYWSLWPEVQFYLFVSTIFFVFRKNFYLVFFVLALIISLVKISMDYLVFSEGSFLYIMKNIFRVFNLSLTLPFFCIGIYFYILYTIQVKALRVKRITHIFFSMFVLIQVYYYWGDFVKLSFYFVFLSLFFLMIFKKRYLLYLENKLFIKLGVSSYFLYLIHESIGVVLIEKFARNNFPFFSILLIIILCAISILYTYYFEIRIAKYLKNHF
ncbi:acyltransferase [Bizionia gelidisalsuginis]|uniref:Acyltransferase n=1 Tax=Bizionia gelidisalsuginis TaxID=291188 RepID=A0ABY3MDF8_9FLAO|nr:acyltransferase [Bizionia gelidisalsuginis]TYC17009.1 acyltransferase [Bizionia gelidisalsuginis]